MEKIIKNRNLIFILAICASLLLLFPENSFSEKSSKKPLSTQLKKKNVNKTLEKLKDGNKRFIEGVSKIKDLPRQREESAKGQKPHTIVVTCSDSRLSPEYIFDDGIGQIFVVRTAGNVVDDVCLGSIEYAAEHLKAGTIVILGHKSCGAVAASISGESESPFINSIIHLIHPAVEESKAKGLHDEELNEEVISENVKNQIKKLHESKIIEELAEKGALSIFGAVYNIKTGKVEFMESEE